MNTLDIQFQNFKFTAVADTQLTQRLKGNCVRLFRLAWPDLMSKHISLQTDESVLYEI